MLSASGLPLWCRAKMVISTCASGRASLTTCLLRRLVGGRIDAIGLSVVMPEGPRRIPGRLSVAPAPPAVRKLSGTYISSTSAFRILAGACLSSRRNVRRTRSATARRCRYSCERRAAVSAPVRKRPRIRQRPSLSAQRQFRRHSLESHQLRALGARVARVQRDS